MKRLIADEATAERIRDRKLAAVGLPCHLGPGQLNYAPVGTIFSYQMDRTGLTLFGVEIATFDANGNRQTEIIVAQ